MIQWAIHPLPCYCLGRLIHTSPGNKVWDCRGLVIDDLKTRFSSIQLYSGKKSQIPKLLLHCGKHHKIEETLKV